jgi:hypothetical protein
MTVSDCIRKLIAIIRCQIGWWLMFYDFVGISSVYNRSHGAIPSLNPLMFILMNNSYFELINDICIPRVTLINDLIYAPH